MMINFFDEKMSSNNNRNNKYYIRLKDGIEKLISYEPSEMMNNLNKINTFYNSISQEINIDTSVYLEEIIMNIFENTIMKYFKDIKYLSNEIKKKLYQTFFNYNLDYLIMLDFSLKLFQQSIDLLEKALEKNNDKVHFGKLYSIVLIKFYLFKVVEYTKNDLDKIDDYKEIFLVINNIKNIKFKKVIMIYILKLFYYHLNNNFELLKYLCDIKLNNIFGDDFSSLFESEDGSIAKYYLLPLDKNKYKSYLKSLKEFEFIKNDKFANNESIKNFILNIFNCEELDIFIILTVNQLFFNIDLSNAENSIKEFNNFFLIANLLIKEKYKDNHDLIKLLDIFYNFVSFHQKIISSVKNKNHLEIILYGFRFCVQSLLSNTNIITEKNEKYLYKSIISENYTEAIINSFIPGADNPEYLHLVTLETIITHLNTKPDRHGCYVCSCGYYYDIDPCGFPTKNRTFDCPVCGLKIGWGPKPVKVGEETHGMVIRPGHIRIFKDQKAKKYQMKVFDEVDENIPNMILEDYINQVIEPIRKKSNKGIVEISKNYFEKKNKMIRNLSQIGYRLLNFILYSHLFFGFCIGNIQENDLKKFLIKDINIIDILFLDWKLLKESLVEKGIGCIQSFMNLIFDDISNLIKNCQYLDKEEERDKFENNIEKIIIKAIEEYNDYSEKYQEENKLHNNLGNYYNIETIIMELIPINEEIYSEKEYPMLKYFNFTNYTSKYDCLIHIPDETKYSLTKQILLEKKESFLLKYLPCFNEFINLMNRTYSFKITREEAKKRKIKDELIFQNPEFIQKFNYFIEIWKEIKIYAIKYKCHSEMPIKDLDSNDYLSYFLHDVNDYGYGMYLAAASQSFIEWQNSFLQNISENNNQGGILHKYTSNFDNKICVNSANPENVLLIEQKLNNSGYKDIEDLIYKYSERNIFKDNKINYNEYNKFKYDYDKIEEELGKIILPGLQMFKSEDDLNLVIYWGEGFRGSRSQVIIDLYMKYPQKELNSQEIDSVINYLKEFNIKCDNLISQSKSDLKQFYGYIQMIIIYLSTATNLNSDTPIIEILKILSSDYNFSKNFINFFDTNKMGISKIMSIFSIFEHWCYKDLILLLKDEFKKEIEANKRKEILKRFNSNEINTNIFSKKDLSAAIRRLICRYLIGTGEVNDIKIENSLCFELSREDLWGQNIKNFDDLYILIKEYLGDLELRVDEAYNLYELIGIEDKNEFNYFFE